MDKEQTRALDTKKMYTNAKRSIELLNTTLGDMPSREADAIVRIVMKMLADCHE